MPAYRNVDSNFLRRSRRLSRQTPQRYDEDGYELYEPFRFPSESSVESSSPASPPASPRPEPYPTCRISRSKRKGNDHVPRPPNAFIVFRSYWNSNQNQSRVTDHRQVSCLAGEEWKKLSEKQKEPFRKEAERRKRQHAIDHPGYRYAPCPRSRPNKPRMPRKKHARDIRDSRAEKAKCDKIVDDLFLKTPIKSERPSTPELVASPSLVASPVASDDDLVYPEPSDDDLVYPEPDDSDDQWVLLEDIPPLHLPPLSNAQSSSSPEQKPRFVFNAPDSLLLGFPGPLTPFDVLTSSAEKPSATSPMFPSPPSASTSLPKVDVDVKPCSVPEQSFSMLMFPPPPSPVFPSEPLFPGLMLDEGSDYLHEFINPDSYAP